MPRYALHIFCCFLSYLVPSVLAGPPPNFPPVLISHHDPAIVYNRETNFGKAGCNRGNNPCPNEWWTQSNEGSTKNLSQDTHATYGDSSLTFTFHGSSSVVLGGKRGGDCTVVLNGQTRPCSGQDPVLFSADGLNPGITNTLRLEYRFNPGQFLEVAGFGLNTGGKTGPVPSPPSPAPAPPASTRPPQQPSSPPSAPSQPAPPAPSSPSSPSPPAPTSPSGGDQEPGTTNPESSTAAPGGSSDGTTPSSGAGTPTSTDNGDDATSSGPSTPASTTKQANAGGKASNGDSSSPSAGDSSSSGDADTDGDDSSASSSSSGTGSSANPSSPEDPSGGAGRPRGNGNKGAIIGGAIAAALLLLLLLLLGLWYLRRWIRARRAPSYAFRNGNLEFVPSSWTQGARPESSVPETWEGFSSEPKAETADAEKPPLQRQPTAASAESRLGVAM